MKIGIIGTGQIGGTLARRLTKLGQELLIANSRGPASLTELAKETGAKPITVAEAARAGQVVVVTIPEAKSRDLPRNLFEGVSADLVVIDTGNYYPRQRDGRIDEIEAGMTESRWVEHQLGRPVVKAFNSIYAKHLLELGRPAGSPGRMVLRRGVHASGKGPQLARLISVQMTRPVTFGTNQRYSPQPYIKSKSFALSETLCLIASL